jgi:hypothetical protein
MLLFVKAFVVGTIWRIVERVFILVVDVMTFRDWSVFSTPKVSV